MRLGLWQVPYSETGGWYHERIPAFLHQAHLAGAELVVFPECFPFWAGGEDAPTEERAGRMLAKHGRRGLPAFIAGGYALHDEHLRNLVYLIHDGEVRGVYAKRWPWAGEGENGHPSQIVPGQALTLFEWDHGACVPLICADVLRPEAEDRAALVAEATALGAGAGVPVVVSAYASCVRGKKWTSRLRRWSADSDAVVAFCNLAGVDREGYGRGGSGLFWPDGRVSRRPRKPGLQIFDLE